VVAVAERLGHENATLVLKTYGHLMPDSEDRTGGAMTTLVCRHRAIGPGSNPLTYTNRRGLHVEAERSLGD
jgi:hypothetical protein